jgi:hypothetical protein
MFEYTAWLERTALSVWIREGSLWAFPIILILHTVGLAFLVGANVALDVRMLGFARGLPLRALLPFFRAMWIGFWVNAVSGVLLLITYPTKALTNPLFYLKLSLITIALVLGNGIRRHLLSGTVPAGASAPQPLRVLATVSLMLWLISITAGRFLAYTCSRLTADQSC